jgi:hypothetical protein
MPRIGQREDDTNELAGHWNGAADVGAGVGAPLAEVDGQVPAFSSTSPSSLTAWVAICIFLDMSTVPAEQ